MQELIIVVNQVAILYVIMFIGVIAGKFKILDSNGTKKLSEFLLYVASPMMVLRSFFIEYTTERLKNIFGVVLATTLMFCISINLSKLIYLKFDKRIKPVLRFTAIYSNCGYVGLPLLFNLFGDEGLFYGSFYLMIFQIFTWSQGYIMFGGEGDKKKIAKKVLTFPGIIAVYVGFIIFIFQIPVPKPISEAVSAVGNMTMPLGMLIIGAVMSTSRLVDILNDWRAYYSSVIRLIIMPLLGLLVASLLRLQLLPRMVLVTALAMPSATNTTIFAELYDKDSLLAARCVAISALFAIVTIPFVIYIAH